MFNSSVYSPLFDEGFLTALHPSSLLCVLRVNKEMHRRLHNDLRLVLHAVARSPEVTGENRHKIMRLIAAFAAGDVLAPSCARVLCLSLNDSRCEFCVSRDAVFNATQGLQLCARCEENNLVCTESDSTLSHLSHLGGLGKRRCIWRDDTQKGPFLTVRRLKRHFIEALLTSDDDLRQTGKRMCLTLAQSRQRRLGVDDDRRAQLYTWFAAQCHEQEKREQEAREEQKKREEEARMLRQLIAHRTFEARRKKLEFTLRARCGDVVDQDSKLFGLLTEDLLKRPTRCPEKIQRRWASTLKACFRAARALSPPRSVVPPLQTLLMSALPIQWKHATVSTFELALRKAPELAVLSWLRDPLAISFRSACVALPVRPDWFPVLNGACELKQKDFHDFLDALIDDTWRRVGDDIDALVQSACSPHRTSVQRICVLYKCESRESRESRKRRKTRRKRDAELWNRVESAYARKFASFLEQRDLAIDGLIRHAV